MQTYDCDLGACSIHVCDTSSIDVKGLERRVAKARDASAGVPVIDLSVAPGERAAWDRSRATVYLWAIFELLFVTNPWQISSKIRVGVLRMFGATIGKDVIFRPRTRVKFPWKLILGNGVWIGEGVWIHNQDQVVVGDNAVISQDTFLSTGSHAHRKDMALITRPIVIGRGAWITARCIVLGGSDIGTSALVTPGSVVSGSIPPNEIWGQPSAAFLGKRFPL